MSQSDIVEIKPGSVSNNASVEINGSIISNIKELPRDDMTDPFDQELFDLFKSSPQLIKEIFGEQYQEVRFILPEFPTGANASISILQSGQKFVFVKGLIVSDDWDESAMPIGENSFASLQQSNRYKELLREVGVYNIFKDSKDKGTPGFISHKEIKISEGRKISFLCLELVDGQSFGSYVTETVKHKGHFSVLELGKIYKKLAVHKAKLLEQGIHRSDNNGRNFLITNKENLTLGVDFGSAYILSEEDLEKNITLPKTGLTRGYLPQIAFESQADLRAQRLRLYDRISFCSTLLLPILNNKPYYYFDKSGEKISSERDLDTLLSEALPPKLQDNQKFRRDLASWICRYMKLEPVAPKLIVKKVGKVDDHESTKTDWSSNQLVFNNFSIEYNPENIVEDLLAIFEASNIEEIEFQPYKEIQNSDLTTINVLGDLTTHNNLIN